VKSWFGGGFILALAGCIASAFHDRKNVAILNIEIASIWRTNGALAIGEAIFGDADLRPLRAYECSTIGAVRHEKRKVLEDADHHTI
jgi:hypothetical protein